MKDLAADHAMWANQWALAALRAQVFVEHRYLQCDVAFLIGGGTQWIGTIIGKQADRKLITTAGDDRTTVFLPDGSVAGAAAPLNEPALEVAAGEVLVLLGPSGSASSARACLSSRCAQLSR